MTLREYYDAESEAERRLPEIEFLHGTVRDETRRIFEEDVPDQFWVAPAAVNHHPPDERGDGGLWLHCKRVFFAFTVIEPTFRAMNAFDQMEANCARAATLLHDAFKYGVDTQMPDESGKYPFEEAHDVLMAEYVRTETDLPERVAECVETHGGSPSWSAHSGPGPHDDLTLAHHLADMMASSEHYGLPVYEPAPELRKMVGDDIDVVGPDAISQ